MKAWVLAIVSTLLVTAACGSEAEVDAAGEAEQPNRTTAPVTWHPQSGHEGPVEGATAALETTSSGASVEIATRELNGGHAYTLWWVVVDNPQECAEHPEPCTPEDLFGNPDVDAQVAYGAGRVVDTGEATFTARLDTGEIPNGWFEGRGLTNPTGAEIHVVLNDHGPELEEFMPDMIRTYRGGCTDESLPEAFPDTAKADGTPGPNTCRLWQSATFQQ